MKKHYLATAIITLFVLLAIGAWGLSAEASPSQQTTLVVDYTNVLTTGFVAQELGVAADRIASVDIVLCDVTFNLPLRTDLDQTFDRQGNVITQRSREVNELTRDQLQRLDEIMRTQGCFRSR